VVDIEKLTAAIDRIRPGVVYLNQKPIENILLSVVKDPELHILSVVVSKFRP
jgi:hypothetical protein